MNTLFKLSRRTVGQLPVYRRVFSEIPKKPITTSEQLIKMIDNKFPNLTDENIKMIMKNSPEILNNYANYQIKLVEANTKQTVIVCITIFSSFFGGWILFKIIKRKLTD